jgi:hypothetical protein
MGDEMKKVIGAITEFALTLITYLYIVFTPFEDVPLFVWGMAVALLGKYGFQKSSEVIAKIRGK